MSKPGSVVHEEITKWPPWAAMILWAAGLGGAILCFRALGSLGGGEPYAALTGFSTLLVVPVGLQVLFGCFRVRVTRTSLRLSFGYTSIITRVVEYTDIEAMAPARYSPLREFGGWGIRSSFRGRKRAWTMRGDRALVLTLSGGARLYVGTLDPDRLAARVRLVADIPSPLEREDE